VRVLGAFWGVVGCLWGHFFSLYEEEDEEAGRGTSFDKGCKVCYDRWVELSSAQRGQDLSIPYAVGFGKGVEDNERTGFGTAPRMGVGCHEFP